jgi:hypothetical protein
MLPRALESGRGKFSMMPCHFVHRDGRHSKKHTNDSLDTNRGGYMENKRSLRELADDALEKASRFSAECNSLPKSISLSLLEVLQRLNDEADYAIAESYNSLFEVKTDERGGYLITVPRDDFEQEVYVVLSRAQDIFWEATHKKYSHPELKRFRMS